MDCGLPGFFIHGVLQARVPEWGAIAFSYEGPRRVKFMKMENRKDGLGQGG